jgi:hypothetical protein
MVRDARRGALLTMRAVLAAVAVLAVVADMLERHHVLVLGGIDLVAARVSAACMVILLVSECEECVPMALESGQLSGNRRGLDPAPRRTTGGA